MGKLLKGRGILRKGDSVGKGGMLLVWLFFLAGVWQMFLNKGGISRREMKKKKRGGGGGGGGGVILFSVL